MHRTSLVGTTINKLGCSPVVPEILGLEYRRRLKPSHDHWLRARHTPNDDVRREDAIQDGLLNALAGRSPVPRFSIASANNDLLKCEMLDGLLTRIALFSFVFGVILKNRTSNLALIGGLLTLAIVCPARRAHASCGSYVRVKGGHTTGDSMPAAPCQGPHCRAKDVPITPLTPAGPTNMRPSTDHWALSAGDRADQRLRSALLDLDSPVKITPIYLQGVFRPPR